MYFYSRKCIWNIVWKMASILSQPQCVSRFTAGDLRCIASLGVCQQLCCGCPGAKAPNHYNPKYWLSTSSIMQSLDFLLLLQNSLQSKFFIKQQGLDVYGLICMQYCCAMYSYVHIPHIDYLISPCAKWLSCRRWHFLMNFHEWKMYFDSNFT